ncbi:TonB-dependent siderophore receptor [Aliamphritea spongicola]|uniref:TonB-dependent siderophore receptor n=1 Tax=Aliamphritea spongicola TaxID=707589 RepID=UPI00196BAB52|nr:TonB-dependent siderophore receptor [Aliamphritea spongicola]MBN3562501.1 TonB-dependent siderophore receptor [Aliamphritea spongicola]
MLSTGSTQLPSVPVARHLLVLATAAALPAMVQAADSSDSQVLEQQDDVVITAQTYRNTGTKSSLEPEETPQGISIIDRETLDLRGVSSINEAMRYTPGVNTELRGGSVVRMDQFTIRGFDNAQNFYDGLQLLYNDWNLQPQIDAAAIEQIEIFKGPTSVLYGAMPPGGMVNIIAKQPSHEETGSISATVGSDNLQQTTINKTGSLAGRDDLSYTFTGLTRKKDSQAVTADEERYLITGSVDWQLTDQTLLNLNLYRQKDPSAGIYNTVPAAGSVFSNPNGKLSTSSYAGDANWNVYERDVTLLGYKLSHTFNDEWSFLQNARFMNADALQKNTYNTGLAADNRTLNRRAYLTDETSKGYTVDNQLSGNLQWGKVEHNLLAGVDIQKLESRIKYEDDVAPSIDLFAPDHHQINPGMTLSNTVYSSDFDIDRKQIGVYLQDQIRIGNWVVIAGGRYDDFESTEKGRKYNAAVDNNVDQTNFSGRIGALYNFENGIAPFVSYAESFEPVSGSDRNGKTFKPATSHQWETGIKFAPLGDDTNMTLSAFRIIKDNVLTRDPSGSAYDQIQAGEVRSQGLEFEISSDLTDKLRLDFTATVLDMEFTKDNKGLKGKTPVWVPESKATLWTNYQLSNAVRLGSGIRYIGKTQLDETNSRELPAYTLVDLAVNLDLGAYNSSLEGTSFNLSVNNLFDKRNVSCYDANNCWFGADRTLEATLKYEF